MSFLKKAFFSASTSLPLKYLYKKSGVQVLLPYHHVVSDEVLPHIQNLYSYKNKLKFIRDLDWLLQNFSPIHPEDLARHFFSGETIGSPSFLLSFDDGYREVYDVIAPMLLQKGVPAIFFINPAFIDNKELFYRCKLSLVIEKIKKDHQLRRKLSAFFGLSSANPDQLRQTILEINYNNRSKADELGQMAEINFDDFLTQQQPFLSTAQIEKLNGQGFVFGAHSWDHPKYPIISLDDQIDQTKRSLAFTNSLRKNNFQFFSFPHQDRYVPGEFFKRIMRSEKNLLLFGLQNQRPETGNHTLHRYNAEDPKTEMALVTKGVLFYNTLLRLKGKPEVERK